MLAYSSIAHAGYALVGVVATMRNPSHASAAVLFLSIDLHGIDGRRVWIAHLMRQP